MSNGRAWSESDTATLRRMARAGYTDAEIARHTGHHPRTIRRQRTAMQIDPCYRVDFWMRKRRWDTIAA